MNSEINAFINKYVKEIRNNNAAFFAGAGFSKERILYYKNNRVYFIIIKEM